MNVTPIATDKAPGAVGPYSQGTVAGPFVFVSGQLGLDPASGALAEGFEAQVRQAVANAQAILQAAGCALTDIAAVDVFVTDLANFKAFNAIYADWLGSHRPARAVVQVSALPLGGVVEVKCMAVKR